MKIRKLLAAALALILVLAVVPAASLAEKIGAEVSEAQAPGLFSKQPKPKPWLPAWTARTLSRPFMKRL